MIFRARQLEQVLVLFVMVQHLAYWVRQQQLMEAIVGVVDDGTMKRLREASHVRDALTRWFAARKVHAVSFSESNNPARDPMDDYTIVYEAVFEPSALDQLRAEVWVADDGSVAVGLETYERIATRIGARARRHKRRIFAAGHEPSQVTTGGLCALLDRIAKGEIVIQTRTFLSYLVTTKAKMPAAGREALTLSGYGYLEWLNVLETESSGAMLKYRPW